MLLKIIMPMIYLLIIEQYLWGRHIIIMKVAKKLI